MKRVLYLLLFAFAAYLLTGVAQIRPEERAVVRRFGQVVAKPGPGLWIGYPYGIDRLDRVPIASVRRVPVGYRPELPEENAGQFLSGDQNLVNIQVAVDYAVGEGTNDLEDFVLHRDRVDSLIARQTEAELAQWVSSRTIDEVLLAGNAGLPTWLVSRVQKRLEAERVGVRLQQVSVVTLSPPDEVRSAFEEVNSAQASARTQEQRARQEAIRLQRDSEASAYQIEQQTHAETSTKRTLAKAEAEAFEKRLQQYRKVKESNPDALAAIWWEEMGKVWLGFKTRGRVDLLDDHLGPDGLDLTQLVPRKR
jgi:membrane protease subunit HflK